MDLYKKLREACETLGGVFKVNGSDRFECVINRGRSIRVVGGTISGEPFLRLEVLEQNGNGSMRVDRVYHMYGLPDLEVRSERPSFTETIAKRGSIQIFRIKMDSPCTIEFEVNHRSNKLEIEITPLRS